MLYFLKPLKTKNQLHIKCILISYMPIHKNMTLIVDTQKMAYVVHIYKSGKYCTLFANVYNTCTFCVYNVNLHCKYNVNI